MVKLNYFAGQVVCVDVSNWMYLGMACASFARRLVHRMHASDARCSAVPGQSTCPPNVDHDHAFVGATLPLPRNVKKLAGPTLPAGWPMHLVKACNTDGSSGAPEFVSAMVQWRARATVLHSWRMRAAPLPVAKPPHARPDSPASVLTTHPPRHARTLHTRTRALLSPHAAPVHSAPLTHPTVHTPTCPLHPAMAPRDI